MKNETSKLMPLKGFIIANGGTDYRVDCNQLSVEVTAQFNIYPRAEADNYK